MLISSEISSGSNRIFKFLPIISISQLSVIAYHSFLRIAAINFPLLSWNIALNWLGAPRSSGGSIFITASRFNSKIDWETTKVKLPKKTIGLSISNVSCENPTLQHSGFALAALTAPGDSCPLCALLWCVGHSVVIPSLSCLFASLNCGSKWWYANRDNPQTTQPKPHLFLILRLSFSGMRLESPCSFFDAAII